MTPRETYERDGYHLHDEPLLPADVVAAAAAGMERVRAGDYATGVAPQPSPWNPGDADDVLCKIEMPQLADPDIRRLVAHPALGAAAAAVTGAEWVQAWWVQLLHKPATAPDAAAVNVGWHQDRHYWGAWAPDSELFTAWVAISDVGPEAGPMRFVRGSHRWGYLGEGDFFGQQLEAQRHEIHPPRGAAWQEVSAHLPAGGASFHHCLTFHASSANVSGTPRRSFAIHMRTQDSAPAADRREGLVRFLDDREVCPYVFGAPD